MPVIQPPKPKHKYEDLGDTLRFTIPNPKVWIFVIWLIPVCFVVTLVCVLGIVFVLRSNSIEPLAGSFIGYVSGVVCWTPYIVLPYYALLWQLTGKEVIEVTQHSIKVRRSVIGLGHAREYQVSDILNIRVTPGFQQKKFSRFLSRQLIYLLRSFVGKAVFDYGSKEIRFAGFVDEAEVTQIVEIIQDRFPEHVVMSKQIEAISANSFPRLGIVSTRDSIRITIPSRKSLHSFILPGIYVFAIPGFLLIAVYFVSTGAPSDTTAISPTMEFSWVTIAAQSIGILFFGGMFLIFVVNWLAMLYQFLWPMFGCETIEITSDALVLHYQVSFYQWSNTFSGDALRNLRVTPFAGDSLFPAPMMTKNKGQIAFDYGAKTFHCGNDADESEARQIVALIHERFPQYR